MMGRLNQRVAITSSLMRRSVAGCGALVLIGVMLTVALIGAVVIASADRRAPREEPP